MEIKTTILLLLSAYLAGSIPFGYLISKFRRGVDVRAVGSRNPGVTNIIRTQGLELGLAVLMSNIAQGAIPGYLYQLNYRFEPWLGALIVLCCCLGSVFPIWLKFKGGKGVGVFIGGLMPLLGPALWFAVMLCWLLAFLFLLKRRMSVASLLLVAGISLFLVPANRGFIPLIAVTALVFWAHRENISRIARGEEKSLQNLPRWLGKIPGNIPGWVGWLRRVV